MIRHITMGVVTVVSATVVGLTATMSFGTAMRSVASTASTCGDASDCTPDTFAETILTEIGAPVTPANLFAMKVWEKSEGGGGGCRTEKVSTRPWWSSGPWCNPLGTSQQNAGSRRNKDGTIQNWNTHGVQAFVDAANHTGWYWGLQATAKTITGGLHDNIYQALKMPLAGNTDQCNHLKTEVTNPKFRQWGTANWASCYTEPYKP